MPASVIYRAWCGEEPVAMVAIQVRKLQLCIHSPELHEVYFAERHPGATEKVRRSGA